MNGQNQFQQMPKIHIITPTESAYADTEEAPARMIQAALAEKKGATFTESCAEADALVLFEKFSFKDHRYRESLAACPLINKYAGKLFTVNFDDAASGLLPGCHVGLRKSRFQKERHRSIPYYKYPNQFILTTNREAPPQVLATYRGNPKSNKLRQTLLEIYKNHSSVEVESTNSWMNHGPQEQQHYVEHILKGHFALCPAGWAPVSFRIYEAMALGRVPVILADEFTAPQYIQWERFSLRIREREIQKLPELLEAHRTQAAEMGRVARTQWEQYCSPETVWGWIGESLLDCIIKRGPVTRESEIRRWQSKSMAWRNQWTIPQRVMNRLRRALPHT